MFNMSTNVVTVLRTWLILVLTPLLLSACGGGGTSTAAADACTTTSTSPITNFCVSTKDTLWRGSKPDAIGSAWLLENGVKTIVNLELINDDLASLTSAKVSPAGQYDVNYFRIRNFEPVVALAPALQDEQIAQFLAIMATSAKPVYVHCRSGQNRTGVNVAAYRVLVENVPVETAISEMEKYQGFWFSYDADYIRSIDQKPKTAILAAAVALTTQTKPLSVVKCRNGVCTSS